MRTIVFTLISSVVLAVPVVAQLPIAQLKSIYPSGAKSGSSLEIKIDGTNLDDADQLVFSHAGISGKAKLNEPNKFDEQPLPVENTFIVTVDGSVPEGRYEVRSRGKYGLSNPRTFLVSSQVETLETEPNGGNSIPEVIPADAAEPPTGAGVLIEIPASINGQSGAAADVDWYQFSGTGGQRIIFEGFAKRIDSQIDLTMMVLSAGGDVIAEARRGACGDSVLDATLPADGIYFLKVHDALYRGGSDYYYRITAGAQPYVDFVFPPAGALGSNGTYTIYGCNLPGGKPSTYQVDGCPLEAVDVQIAIDQNAAGKLSFPALLGPHQGGIDGLAYRAKSGALLSNPVMICPATAPIVREQDGNDAPKTAQKLQVPCEIVGQFYPQRDVDWFTFDAKQGESLAIDLYTHRLGLEADAAMLIQQVTLDSDGNEKVRDIQFVDDVQEPNVNNKSGRHEFDHRSTDPYYLFTAPADGTYRVMIRDGSSSVRSDPRLVYRLAIRRPAPDYRIVAVPANSSGSLLLRRGGRQLVRIFVFRYDGFNEEVHVSCKGLPAGVTTDEITIGPGNTMGTLVLTTSPEAQPSTSTLTVTSRAMIDGKEISREARYGAATEPFQFSTPNARLPSARSRIVDGIQCCVTDYDPAPVLLTIGEGKPVETSRGARIKVPYQVKKADGTSGNLNGYAMDYPPQASISTVSIGGNEKGEFEIRLTAATPPGTYSIYLAGYQQGFRYSRNPEMAEWAKQRQDRIAKLYTDSQKKTQDAQKLATTKQTELQTATNTLNQLKPKKQQADQALTAAMTALKQAQEKQTQVEQDAAKQEDQAAAKTAIEQAKAATGEVTKKLEAAQKTADDLATQLQQSEKAVKDAEAAKKQADEDLASAREFQTKAQQEKTRADQLASRKKTESNPRNINIHVPSNSLVLKVAEFPINVDTLAEAVSIKQGEKQTLPVKLTRLYDFAAAVSVQLRLASGVSGLSPKNLSVATNKTDGQLEITASSAATVGTHECTVRLQMNFNGQNLVMDRPLKITVVEVKPEK